MELKLIVTAVEGVECDALAVICFERPEAEMAASTSAADSTGSQSADAADPKLALQSGWLAELRSTGEFTGKLYETAMLFRPEGAAAKRLVLIGGGKREKFSAVEGRRLGGVLVRVLRPKGLRHVALQLEVSDGLVAAVAEGAVLGSWEPDKYRTDPKKDERQIESLTLVVPGGDRKTLESALQRGWIIAEAQNGARDLVNEPPNRLVPADLAAAAKSVAEEWGLESEILDRERMAELGMGALLGVSLGSSRPPFLIVLRYRPGVVSGSDHLALIGKGVTFDTGGLSIKPSDGMEKMKYDMAGGAAVIGAMRAIAQLKPVIPVSGYIPAVENMINGEAQRPGDIVTTLSGKTVEVLNTDAEGRLILADAITYANRNGVTHIVDAATLTGAITVALGHHNIGAFTNDQKLLDRVFAAGRAAGEKAWQLPLDEEYKEYLKSAFADLPNIGGRAGGSITAAWFLREFADPTPWVHLDIASTAWLDDGKAWISKGPTGVAVRTFVALALNWQTS